MSATEDKNPAVSEGGESRQKEGGFVIVFFICGFVVSLLVGWIVFPNLLYSKKQQPFNFNHALHMDMVGEGCESCHYFREDGTFSGIPGLYSCMDCHEEVQGGTEDEVIFVEQYVWENKEVPWLVYSKQPDCVFFSHVAHVKNAEMDCEYCHGHIGSSSQSRVYEENRISGYSRDIWGPSIAGFKSNTWDRMKMDDCSECHVKNNVKQNSVQTHKGACFVCHQ